MTLKVTGSQWYWSYEYPDHGKIAFDSLMIPDNELKPGQLRLLDVDNRVVVPVDTNIRVLLTSNAVIHAWAVPAFGIKIDTVPGRMNETWMRVTKPGVYYGQCSELCGINHGYMPIAVQAVSKADFAKWVAQAKVKFKAEQAPERASPNIALAGGSGPRAVPVQ
jgi:cytochrome c oxidase subunit 2